MQSKYVLVVALVITSIAVAAQPIVASWAVFNGFFPGMSKAAAKGAGYASCRLGKGLPERSDSVYCEVPSGKRALGSLSANSALVEFRSHNAEVVGEMHLTFEAKVETVRAALASQYGQPMVDGQYYTWQRNGPETILLFRRQRSSTAFVTFEYDKSMGKAREKAARDAQKKKAVLKSF